MTLSLHLFMQVVALAFFMFAGLGMPEHPRLRYIGWGLFLWLLASLVRI